MKFKINKKAVIWIIAIGIILFIFIKLQDRTSGNCYLGWHGVNIDCNLNACSFNGNTVILSNGNTFVCSSIEHKYPEEPNYITCKRYGYECDTTW